METMALRSSLADVVRSVRSLRREVVGLVPQPGNTVGRVARELNLTETAVRAWLKQADIDDGRAHAESVDDWLQRSRIALGQRDDLVNNAWMSSMGDQSFAAGFRAGASTEWTERAFRQLSARS